MGGAGRGRAAIAGAGELDARGRRMVGALPGAGRAAVRARAPARVRGGSGRPLPRRLRARGAAAMSVPELPAPTDGLGGLSLAARASRVAASVLRWFAAWAIASAALLAL